MIEKVEVALRQVLFMCLLTFALGFAGGWFLGRDRLAKERQAVRLKLGETMSIGPPDLGLSPARCVYREDGVTQVFFEALDGGFGK